MPHTGRKCPLIDRISLSDTFARKIMHGTTMEKLGAILDIVKVCADGQIKKREAKAILLGALQDESRQVRWSAVYAFGQMNDLPGLLEGIDNDCQVVRSMSAAMIYATLKKREIHESFHPDRFMESLAVRMAENIGSDDRSVAIYCASALSEIAKRDPVSVIKVIKGMKEETDDVGAIMRLRGVEMAADDALSEMALKNRA